jgi:alpha-tubulin suppressor-like RCC1 family protein
VCFSAGEEHIIFMNGRGELYGIGNNQYGQLGNRSNNMRNTINRVFEEINAKRIYCTEYATFIVNRTPSVI